MNGRTQLVRWDTRTGKLDGWTDIIEPERGETPARFHELAVAADHTLWLGENDHHSRWSWLWKVQVLCLCLAALVLGACGAANTPQPEAKRATRPAWVKRGIVMAGNWEPLTFIRRRGGCSMSGAALSTTIQAVLFATWRAATIPATTISSRRSCALASST